MGALIISFVRSYVLFHVRDVVRGARYRPRMDGGHVRSLVRSYGRTDVSGARYVSLSARLLRNLVCTKARYVY